MTSAKRKTLRIAKIIFTSMRRAPMFAIAGTLTMKVIRVFRNALLPLKKNKRRTILNDLIMVV
jgi:NADH:ubiquinone oxidoreductase subunit B-like Fe-S oxidoreductase